MFKSEAKLFLSANNNLNYAKTLINECKRLVNEIELQGNSDYTKCKNNITNCDIDGLANKVETTRESLMKLDQGFASEYMTLLQEYLQTTSIDTSNMTDEEKMQYSIQMSGYARDYNYSLLYMLEKYEESGMLTPELQAQLEMQRTIVEQYDVQDKMAALTTTSQEYIDLFKANAEYDKKLINLNPNLTEEEKASYLKEYENSFNSTLEILELNRDVAKKTDELKKLEAGSEAYYKKENEIRQIQINYYEGKGSLTEQEQKQLDFLKDGVELNELYIDKEQNNGFWHPFIEGEYDEAILDKKIEMGIATEDEIAYDKMNGWERAWENTKTFSTSVVFGIGSVTETIVDGGAMLAGEVGSWFGADTQWAEDFVSIHYADDAYTGLVQSDCINSVSAYSGWHTAGNMVGTTVGYVALSYLPGGPIVTGLAGGFSAMGSSSQRALDSGATFHEAFGTGAISFGAGFVSGWAVGKLGALAQGSTSLMQVGGYTLAGMGVSTLEPIVNSVAEYAIYADEMVDENGNKVYDNIWDYYVDGGGLTNTVMAGVSGGISVGAKGLKAYSEVKSYASNEGISKEQLEIAQKNYEQHSSDFNSRKEYFDSLDYVERNYSYGHYDDAGMWVPNKGLDANDPGLTASLTEQRKLSWNDEVAANTIDGKTKVNVGTTNAAAFDRFVVEGGALGVPGDYNFGRLGDVDSDVFVQRATSNGTNVVNQFEGDTGIPSTKNNRVCQYSYDADSSTVSMHTGKEAGSNSQRLAGGYLPDNSTEVVIKATTVSDVGGASSMFVSIMDDSGKKLFTGSLQDLIDLKSLDLDKYNYILGI